jgi:hypothetical protein
MSSTATDAVDHELVGAEEARNARLELVEIQRFAPVRIVRRAAGLDDEQVPRVELDDAVAPHALHGASEAQVEHGIEREHALVAEAELLHLDVGEARHRLRAGVDHEIPLLTAATGVVLADGIVEVPDLALPLAQVRVQEIEHADRVLADADLVLELEAERRARQVPLRRLVEPLRRRVVGAVRIRELVADAARADVAVGEVHLARELAVLVVEEEVARVLGDAELRPDGHARRPQAVRGLLVRLERQQRLPVHLVEDREVVADPVLDDRVVVLPAAAFRIASSLRSAA